MSLIETSLNYKFKYGKNQFSLKTALHSFWYQYEENNKLQLVPNIDIGLSLKNRLSHDMTLSMDNVWVNNNARSDVAQRYGLTDIVFTNIENTYATNFLFKYDLKYRKNINEYKLNMRLNVADKQLLNFIDFNLDDTITQVFINNDYTYNFTISPSFNTLLFKKVFFEISSGYNISNGFFSLTSTEDKETFTSTNVSFKTLVKRTISDQYAVTLNTGIDYFTFILDGNTNRVNSFLTEFKASKRTKRLALNYLVSFQKIGDNRALVINDLYSSYKLSNRKFTLNFKALNLFNISQIQSDSISELLIRNSTYQLPGIRLLVGLRYQF